MDHADHVGLLRPGIDAPGGVWADFGAGGGAFTLALADLLGPAAHIHAVDRDRRALHGLQRRLSERFPAAALIVHPADYTRPLPGLPALDGLIMANALHFQRDKLPVLDRLLAYLKPGGRFILIEYDTDRGNRWVPHPLSYSTWAALATQAGLVDTRRLATRPSSFLGSFFSALSFKPA